MRYWIIIICLMCSGCAVHTHFYLPDETGIMKEVAEIKQDSAGLAEFSGNGMSMKCDTRKPNWFEQNILPIFMGATAAAKDSISTPM